jgi:hypothetical protein
MTTDETKLGRQAQYLNVEIARGYGIPPYHGNWEPLYDAKVESITDNQNATPSELVFYLPGYGWDDDASIYFGDKIRISTVNEEVVFIGYVTKILQQFSGGTEGGGKYERLGIYCLDIRWLIAVSCPIYGQIGIGADDEDQAGFPLAGEFTLFGGRRCIFNPDGIPNRHKDGVTIDSENQACFVNPDAEATDSIFWNWEDMAKYLLGPVILDAVKDYIEFDLDKIFTHSTSDWLDWIKIHKNITVEGLNPMSALQIICKQIGWGFRLSYKDRKEDATIEFFKTGRSKTKHSLYAPPRYKPGGDKLTVKKAVQAGKKMLVSAQIESDISNIINSPFLLASRNRIEFTAELVPAWLDEDLTPDIADENANIFISEADLETMENPAQYTFYKYYHSGSTRCKRAVGRIWSLNESGKYSLNTTYDRGDPFDLSTILPKEYAHDENGKKNYGYFDHTLLPCLSLVLQNSVGILVEVSFDCGSTWQVMNAAITSLDKEAGIQISEANLSEIKPKPAASIEGGDLDGIELNYWTSLCRDKLSGQNCKQWNTRVRVTASMQLEQRMQQQIIPTSSGSPFYQADVIDVSNNFFKQARHSSSLFSSASMPADERDDYVEFKDYIDKLKKVLEDTAISGRFLLERLWFGTFNIGDGIEKIEGRDYSFKTSYGNQDMYPEIVQITYWPQKQKMQLITRDLRFSENRPG